MHYRFRLRVASKQDKLFAFDTPEEAFKVSDGAEVIVVARDADSLDAAKAFHFDAGGYPTEAAARQAGESLRIKLRLLNALLGLGLNVPVVDTASAQISEEVKNKAAEAGGIAIDSVWGISVYPDDGRHFEYVVAGTVDVRPSEPSYLFAAIQALWEVPIALDAASETALHIVGLATLETSEKAAFLTSYLALEQLIHRKRRSKDAEAILDRFGVQLEKAAARKGRPIAPQEAKSLKGSISNLREESFSSALMRFAGTVKSPEKIRDIPIKSFLSACIDARNKIAHQAEPSTRIPLTELIAGLREVIMMLIWTRTKATLIKSTTRADCALSTV